VGGSVGGSGILVDGIGGTGGAVGGGTPTVVKYLGDSRPERAWWIDRVADRSGIQDEQHGLSCRIVLAKIFVLVDAGVAMLVCRKKGWAKQVFLGFSQKCAMMRDKKSENTTVMSVKPA